VSCGWRDAGRSKGAVRITAEDATVIPNLLTFRVVVPPRGSWQTTVQVSPVIDGQQSLPSFPQDRPVEQAAPAVRTSTWRTEGRAHLVHVGRLLDVIVALQTPTEVADGGILRLDRCDNGIQELRDDVGIALAARQRPTEIARPLGRQSGRSRR
jgi:hypothetical protein